MYSCHSILECYNLFSGVGLSMRPFCFIIIVKFVLFLFGRLALIIVEYSITLSTTKMKTLEGTQVMLTVGGYTVVREGDYYYYIFIIHYYHLLLLFIIMSQFMCVLRNIHPRKKTTTKVRST